MKDRLEDKSIDHRGTCLLNSKLRLTKRENHLERIIVVGNGMVSHRFCTELVKRGGNAFYSTLVFGEEAHLAYDRVHLTDFFKARKFGDLELDSADWYSRNEFTLKTGSKILSIDRQARTVWDESGEAYPYDKLVLACGSYPFIPNIEGIEAPGVFTYRTIEDAESIIAASQDKKSAIVLGGGLLGLEAANALRELGLQTTVVEYANGLMPRQLNEDASQVLEREVRRLGVTTLLSKGAQKVEQQGDELLITFSDGLKATTDLLVVAAGIRANDTLAEQAKIACGARGGVAIDNTLSTSDPHIFAIGECALHKGQIYGFVAPGYQMAETLADRLMGGSSVFEGADLSCRLKLMGIAVSAFGDNLGNGRTLVYRNDRHYRMLVLKRDCLIGGTVVGDWKQTHQLQLAIKENRFMNPGEQALFETKGNLSIGDSLANWPSNAIICNCTQTTKGALSACLSSGCKTSSELTEKTGAGSVCGSCRPLLAQLAGESGVETAYQPKGRKWLFAVAAIAFLGTIAFLSDNPLPEPTSVQGNYYRWSQLWHDSTLKQFSGYTMAGLSLIALALSARKRVSWLRFGNYGNWRALHSTQGTLCLLALLAHTGMDFGENLNLWLMCCFVALNLAGAIAGLTIAMEDRFSGLWARRIRSIVTKAHILFFWPYPVLLGFHIYKAYAY